MDVETAFMTQTVKKTTTASEKTVETQVVQNTRQNPVHLTSGYLGFTPYEWAVVEVLDEVRRNITSAREYAYASANSNDQGRRLYRDALQIIDQALENGQMIQRGDAVYTSEGEYLTNLAMVATLGTAAIKGANQWLGYKLAQMEGIGLRTFQAEALKSGKNPPGTDAFEYKPPAEVQTYYPPNRGFLGDSQPVALQPGTRIDRYGSDLGRYASPEGTPSPQRSLPYGYEASPYRTYEVVQQITVESGKVGPWFGQPGGGTQYYFPSRFTELIDEGVLKLIGG